MTSDVIGTTSDIIKTIQEAFQTIEESSYLQDLLIKDPLFMIPWSLIGRALIALTDPERQRRASLLFRHMDILLEKTETLFETKTPSNN